MKRLAIGFIAAILSLGTLSSSANAWVRAEPVHSRLEHRHSDPVLRALERSDRILLNNYFDGYRYRSAGRFVAPHELQYLGRTWGGNYRIRFQGVVYNAYSVEYHGRLCLYLGSAPTQPGYRFELVLG
jgi:hypothetical protein